VAKRGVSSLVLWAIVIAVLSIFRIPGAVVLVALIGAFTLLEFYRLLAAAGDAPFARLGTFFGVLIIVAPWVQSRFGPRADGLLPLATVIFSVRMLGERQPEKRVPALAATLFGLVYVAVLLQYFVRLLVAPFPGGAISDSGRLLLCLWLVAVAKFSDVGGLLAGMAAGRHPLAPLISPKKTWEGAIGAVAMSMLVGALFARFASGHMPASLTPLAAALTAVPIAIMAIVSDLVESVIKRRAAIKDSGGFIPGIGGFFDMSDSLILIAPVGYFLLGFK
jgi:phosphatidate cytidylyltransferase